MLLKQFGVNVSLWSKSNQQLHTHPCCTHLQHLPMGDGKPLGLSPKMLRCLGIPQSSVPLWDPHLLLQEHRGRASSGRGSGSTDTLGAGGGWKKPFEETRPDKSGGSIQLPCCWEKGAPLWGEGWPSQPSTCPRPAPPALAPAAAAGPAVCPGACQGCQRGPKCSLSPQLPGLPSGEGLRAAGCSSAAPSGVLWGAAPRPGSAYRGIDVPIPSKSSLASFPALTAPPRAGRRCPPPFALILGMLHVPQSPGGSPGG